MLQIINSKDCKNCNDECCRFAPHLKRFAPVFVGEEFKDVINRGYSKNLFKKISRNEYQLKLNKKEKGFFVCDFLTKDERCSINKIKPYDCKIWPFILMNGKGKNKNRVYLMVDAVNECHAIKKASKEKMKRYITYLKKYLESDKVATFLKKYPKMIRDYDCDLTKICYMERLTKRLM